MEKILPGRCVPAPHPTGNRMQGVKSRPAPARVLPRQRQTGGADGNDPAGAPLDAASTTMTVTVEGGPPVVTEFSTLYVPAMVPGCGLPARAVRPEKGGGASPRSFSRSIGTIPIRYPFSFALLLS
ncbi:MAG TPA: hypothetical protein ENN44_07025 [Methanoculleus sp.]|nr:hypothetical protein [Methanoculleus sp.]